MGFLGYMNSQGRLGLQTGDTATAAQGQCSEEGHRCEALAAKYTEAQGYKRGSGAHCVGENHSFLEQKEMKEKLKERRQWKGKEQAPVRSEGAEMVKIEEEKPRNSPPASPVFLPHSLPLTVAIVTVSLTALSSVLRPHSAESSEEVIHRGHRLQRSQQGHLRLPLDG